MVSNSSHERPTIISSYLFRLKEEENKCDKPEISEIDDEDRDMFPGNPDQSRGVYFLQFQNKEISAFSI